MQTYCKYLLFVMKLYLDVLALCLRFSAQAECYAM